MSSCWDTQKKNKNGANVEKETRHRVILRKSRLRVRGSPLESRHCLQQVGSQEEGLHCLGRHGTF